MLPAARARSPAVEHEADLLAQAFGANPSLSIRAWAIAANVSREGLSRSFHRAYGVCAAKFRNDLRARAAWRACVGSDDGLASVAAALGYADQPHMTRAVQWLTGATPALWRRWKNARQ
jgi:AraC-like DNA-binding protein